MPARLLLLPPAHPPLLPPAHLPAAPVSLDQVERHKPTRHQAPAPAALSMRGVGPEALRLIDRYGLVPYQFEKSHINNGAVLERKLRLILRQSRSLTDLRTRMKAVMPEFSIADTSFDPDSPSDSSAAPLSAFYYYSFRYTPQVFAESVMYYLHYEWYAYDATKPLNRPFVLNDADNRRHHTYINMTYKEQLRRVIRSVNDGHAVYWEYGKNHTSGHAMAIVGLRKGKDGKPYLLCLNSYGSSWGEDGHCLISLPYFIANTCNIGLQIEN